MGQSKIQWCDHTWNVTCGCRRVSEGCRNCYAVKMAHRLGGNPATPLYKGLTIHSHLGVDWTGEVRALRNNLSIPLRRKKPTRYFVNSMSDLFHGGVCDDYIAEVFGVMAACPQHAFVLLTKRPERMREWFAWNEIGERTALSARRQSAGDDINKLIVSGTLWPLPNVWIGVSVEDQATFDSRIIPLRETPAAKHIISYEPALGPVDFGNLAGIDWVIAGSETGPRARPSNPDWFRAVRDQCAKAGVPFFFKQHFVDGKKTELLDGKEYKEIPK